MLLALLLVLLSGGCRGRLSEAGENWPVYLGGNSSNQYSPLDQINRENVGKLQVAWEHHTGDDVSGNHSQIQCNPLVIDGVLYGTSPKLNVFALDAVTGQKLWEFDPHPEVKFALNVNRGVTYWEKNRDKRILFTSGPDLFELDAVTGKPVTAFGDSGHVSLKEGLGDRAKDLYVVATSPGIVYKDLLIIGSTVNEEAGAAPGFIRAFSIPTGHLEWVFHTIPQPGEYGYDTWPDSAWKTAGGANCWAGMSLDKKRGLVFIPTGSAVFDFWGGNRKGKDLFANTLLALDAATGQREWHFQTVYHDLWDRDLPAPPNLITVQHDGRMTDAVAQITKSGFVYLLDRSSGQPLFPVEERPVPASRLEGEEAWPVQPFPVKPPPFSPQKLTSENITDITPGSHEYVAGILRHVLTGQQFIPPDTAGMVIFPGFDGGGEWGGAAFDPHSGILYVNGSIMPWILTMVKVDTTEQTETRPGKHIYMVHCAVCHGRDRQGSAGNIYPALTHVADKYSHDEILKIINTGKGFMPSFRNLKKEEKQAVIDYITGSQDENRAHGGQIARQQNEIPYTFTGYNRFLDSLGYPAVKPPWGNLSAIDMNEGVIRWQVPLGDYPELNRSGSSPTGTENYGGPVVTAGGLIFIAASKDEYIRAFDKETGKELWKYKLPAGGYATPSIYEAGGKEYVVIACGGGKMATTSGDSYMAFCLR